MTFRRRRTLHGVADDETGIEDEELEIEEGALDPDELDDFPPDWDEGADDEL